MFNLLEMAWAVEPPYFASAVAGAHAIGGRLEQLADDHAAGRLALDEEAVVLLERYEAYALANEYHHELQSADNAVLRAADERVTDVAFALLDCEDDPGDIRLHDTLGRAAQAIVMARQQRSEEHFENWFAEVLVMAEVPSAAVRAALNVIEAAEAADLF